MHQTHPVERERKGGEDPLGGNLFSEETMSKKEKNCCEKSRLGAVGGSAVLEGVMMKSNADYAVAVRTESGELRVTKGKFISARKKHKWLNLPILRGCISFVESMILSIRTLGYSATLYGTVEDEKGEVQTVGKKAMGALLFVAGILAILLSVFLFMYLPAVITAWIDRGVVHWFGVSMHKIVKNLTEGGIKLAVLLVYLAAISCMKDIRRTFQYHGAEHKSIFCYEAGEELTPENVRKFSRFHPRCGTSFLFVMILLGVLISSLPFVPWDNRLARTGVKLLLIPVTMGLGFEFLMLTGKHQNVLTKILSAPGMWVQRLTTREPDDSQLEVAILSLKCAMPEVFGEEIPAGAILTDPATYAEELKAQARAKKAGAQDSMESDSTESGGPEAPQGEDPSADPDATTAS